jgi:hypothetical protein
MTAKPAFPGVVVDAVSSILTQANLGEEFRADFEKRVGDAYAAGAASTEASIKSVPATDAEIAAFRDYIRAIAASVR